MLSGRSMFKPDYTCNRCSSLNTFIVIVLLIHGSLGQDLAVPDDNLSRIISRNYLPLQFATTDDGIPVTTASPEGECGVNMSLRELDDGQKYCECPSGYIYHSETNGCYKLYTRGPCENGHHFIVQPKTMVAGCVPNPCKTDGEVFFRGHCHGLHLPGGPCDPREALTISVKTHQLVCGPRPVPLPRPDIVAVPQTKCPSGTGYTGPGMCRPRM